MKDTQETQPEQTQPEQTQPEQAQPEQTKPEVFTIEVEGKSVELSKEEMLYLAKHGAQSFVEKQQLEKVQEEDKPKQEPKMNDTERRIAELEQQLQQQKEMQARDRHKQAMERALDSTGLTGEDRQLVEEISIARIAKGNTNISEVVNEVKQYLENRDKARKESYINQKKEDKELTQGAPEGGAPGQEPVKFTAADLKSGKIKQAAKEYFAKAGKF